MHTVNWMSAKEITYFGCGYLFRIVISISEDIGSEFRYGLDIGLELPITIIKVSKLSCNMYMYIIFNVSAYFPHLEFLFIVYIFCLVRHFGKLIIVVSLQLKLDILGNQL